MIGSGVYFAVDERTVQKLRSLGAAGASEYILKELEPLYLDEFPEQTFEMEGYWEAIHRALTGDFLFDGGETLADVILGGEIISCEGLIISAKSLTKVGNVCKGLSDVTRLSFKEGYEAIDPNDYPDKSSDDCSAAYEFLTDSLAFWKLAEKRGLWVLFTAEI